MKNIAIISESMLCGGTEKALISMLNSIPKNKYEITLFLFEKKGILLDEIPSWINVKCIERPEKSIKEIMIENLKNFNFLKLVKNFINGVAAKYAKSDTYYKQKSILSFFRKNEENFDVAISYYLPTSLQTVYTISHIKADKKIAWIHMDVSKQKKEIKTFKNIFERYDYIACVSQDCLKKFIHIFPKFKNKSILFYNIIDKKNIYKLSNESIAYKDDFDGIRLFSCSRLTLEKQPELAIDIIKKLIENGYNVKWYWAGDGELMNTLKDRVNRENLSENMIFLGAKKNPYNFMKDSDIFIQLSLHESYCLSLAEARLLNKPIVTTNFNAAYEQIKDGYTGIISDSKIDSLYNNIVMLIDNISLREKLVKNLQLEKKNIYKHIELLYQIID